jgi:hypothetical protein
MENVEPQQEIRVQGISATLLLNEVRRIIAEEIKISQQNQEEKLLSPLAACKIFNPKISRGTLHNWEREGVISSYILGGKKLFRLSDILDACKKVKRYSPTIKKLRAI